MPTDAEIEAGAAALFAFGFPDADPQKAWAFLLDDYKPLYRARARAVLIAATETKRSGED